MHQNSIKTRIEGVKHDINAALAKAKRKPNSAQLLCVSKYASLEQIQEAIATGEHCFAENYLQDALIEALQAYDLEWYFSH